MGFNSAFKRLIFEESGVVTSKNPFKNNAIMFPFYVLYECATWSIILREEQHIFRLYDNRVQKAGWNPWYKK